MFPFKHLPDIVKINAKNYPTKGALYYKQQSKYTALTYQEFNQCVENTALGLQDLGVKAGDHIGILSNNCPEWAIGDMAILSLSAVTIPIYPTLSAPEIQYILNDTELTSLIFETQEHLEKINKIKEACPSLKKIIFINEQTIQYHKDDGMPFSHLMKRGSQLTQDKKNRYIKERQLP